jgi:hypothetical protein
MISTIFFIITLIPPFLFTKIIHINPEKNFTCFHHVIALKNMIHKGLNFVVNFFNQDDNYRSIIYNLYTMLGEPIEIFSSIKPIYCPSLIMDESVFIHCAWTSQRADREAYKIVNHQ